jgi:hypothetical protein
MSDIRKLIDLLSESSVGATASGNVATVEQSAFTQSRSTAVEASPVLEYGNWENSALSTSKKLKKTRTKASKLVKSIYGEDAIVKESKSDVAEAKSPAEFIGQMKKLTSTEQQFNVGDWVTIDPNETSGYASSGMTGRIVELYTDEGEQMAKIDVGGGGGVQTKMKTYGGTFGPPGTTIGLGKGVRSYGTYTVVPTSILQKDDPQGVAEGLAEAIASGNYSVGLEDIGKRVTVNGDTGGKTGYVLVSIRYSPRGLDAEIVDRKNGSTGWYNLTDISKSNDQHLGEQGVAEGSLNEIGYSDKLGNLNVSDSEIIASATQVGTISQKPVMKYEKHNTTLFFFSDDEKISALILLVDGNKLRAIKNFSGQAGQIYALINYIVNIDNRRLVITSDEPLTKEGFNWIARLIKEPTGIKVSTLDGASVDVKTLHNEWLKSKSTRGTESGETGLVISESSQKWKNKLQENETRLIPHHYFNVTSKSREQDVAEEQIDEVAGAQKCWSGHRKVGTQPGTGKNAGQPVNKCKKISKSK